MCEPKYDLIEKTLLDELKKEFGQQIELIGEWDSEYDFAYYCWVEKLGHVVEYPDIVNWQKLFLNLPQHGFVGKYLTVRSGTNNDIICSVVYGFEIN